MKRGVEVLLITLILISIAFVLTYPGHSYVEKKYNVLIEAEYSTPYGDMYSLGSGVIITQNGVVMTAAHCVRDASSLRVTILETGQVFDVNMVDCFIDDIVDVAFIDLPGTFSDFAEIPDPNFVFLEKGDRIYGIGNSYGIHESCLLKGEIEKVDFRRLFCGKDVKNILLTLPDCKPGCSGGGIYKQGKLIGIVSMGWDEDDIIIVVSFEECRKVFERYVDVFK